MSELEIMQNHFDRLKAQGVSDIKFAVGDVSNCTAEEFAEEANRLFDAINAKRGRPLRLNDSRRVR